MPDPKHKDSIEHEFEEVQATPATSTQRLALDDLKKVCLTVSADLGRCEMLVRDVLRLQPGSVVSLDKLAGEMTDIYANGLPLARGEVVVIGDTLHVRIGEIVGTLENEVESPVQE